MLFPILWMPIAYSIREISTRFKNIGGCCTTCLDYIGGVLREYKILATDDPDDNFDDFAAVINFITGGPDRGDVPVEAYMDYTIESTYLQEKGTLECGEENDSERCPICLADFENDVPITELNCLHIYHSSCAKSWFENNWLCPMCRADIRYTIHPKLKGKTRHFWLI